MKTKEGRLLHSTSQLKFKNLLRLMPKNYVPYYKMYLILRKHGAMMLKTSENSTSSSKHLGF